MVAKDAAPRGLYIGCGTRRDYLPLVDAGLDLVGLDILQGSDRSLRGQSVGVVERSNLREKPLSQDWGE